MRVLCLVVALLAVGCSQAAQDGQPAQDQISDAEAYEIAHPPKCGGDVCYRVLAMGSRSKGWSLQKRLNVYAEDGWRLLPSASSSHVIMERVSE